MSLPAQSAGSGSIAAVVVTRNRLALLQECVNALRAQTRKLNEIIVVDNGSDDGTAAWLSEQKDVTVIIQSNTGGAGGQYTGTKAAYLHSHDWLWLMDDDGRPAADCLQQLLEVDQPGLLYRAPLVLDRDDHEVLAFVIGPPTVPTRLTTRTEALAAAKEGLIAGVACPFNGVLLHRQVFTTIGFPLKQMFMWGDETEFTLRARRAGVLPATCVQAIHFHPRDRMKARSFRFCGRTLYVLHVGNPLRDYLIVRNNAYIARVYLGWYRALRHTTRYAAFYLSEYGLAAALGAFRSSVAGMCGVLTGHKKFLAKKV